MSLGHQCHRFRRHVKVGCRVAQKVGIRNGLHMNIKPENSAVSTFLFLGLQTIISKKEVRLFHQSWSRYG